VTEKNVNQTNQTKPSLSDNVAASTKQASATTARRAVLQSQAGMQHSRRKFLQSATVATGVVAAGMPMVHAASDSPIRVGLIGCGGRGTGAAVNAMKADPNVQIVALADLFGEAMDSCRTSLEKRYPAQFKVTDDTCYEGFDAYKQMVASDVDVVLLASPPHYRPDHIEAAVDGGKEIFCEKPVAVDAVGVRRVEAACKKADEKGLNVVSGLCWRYDKGMKETISRIQDGQIGNIVSTQADYLTSPVWIRPRREGDTQMQYECRNWYYYNWLSGDHYVEQFIHSLDKAMWLRGDEPPVRAYGLGGRQNRSDLTQGNIYDHFAVIYEWADGTRTYANTRQIAGCFRQVEDFVFGSAGSAKLCAHEIEGSTPWKFKGDEVQMHQAEQNEFFKALRGERARINNGDYMCKSTMMAILGREVCYTGGTLTYDEVANGNQDLRPKSYTSTEGHAAPVPIPGEYKHPTA
tara:strand:+ start:167769 stop:169157 length:1389 start_codon:yes stop_codon:yes gene_type:complete